MYGHHIETAGPFEHALEGVLTALKAEGFGVLSTPGVIINGKVVHVGGVPSRDKIKQWLTAPA